MDTSNCCDMIAASYVSRPPERLVLEGLRSASDTTGNSGPGAAITGIYGEILGERFRDFALNALTNFLNALDRCANCPYRHFAPGTPHVSRDEALVLGLLASIQHGDEVVTKLCLDELTCPLRCEPVAAAAASFAVSLRIIGQELLPIPQMAIMDILVRSGEVTVH